jgi:hypothetical protein
MSSIQTDDDHKVIIKPFLENVMNRSTDLYGHHQAILGKYRKLIDRSAWSSSKPFLENVPNRSIDLYGHHQGIFGNFINQLRDLYGHHQRILGKCHKPIDRSEWSSIKPFLENVIN